MSRCDWLQDSRLMLRLGRGQDPDLGRTSIRGEAIRSSVDSVIGMSSPASIEEDTADVGEPTAITVQGLDGLWVADRSDWTIWRLYLDGRMSPYFCPSISRRLSVGLGCTGDAASVFVLGSRMPMVIAIDKNLEILRCFGQSIVLGEMITPESAVIVDDGSMIVGHTDRDERYGGGLLRLPLYGEATWLWRPGPADLLEPSSIHLTRENTLLVADPQLHVVTEVSITGDVLWRYGCLGSPGKKPGLLRAPTDCRQTVNGVIVADSMNDRVIEVDDDGTIIWEVGYSTTSTSLTSQWIGRLSSPRSAVRLANGETVIADTGNGRVLYVSANGKPITSWGRQLPAPRLFSHPRSLEFISEDRWLVADTNNHRVIEVDQHGAVRRQYGDGEAGGGQHLHWPRCARVDKQGLVIVADGLNRRVLWFNSSGAIVRESSLLHCRTRHEVFSLVDPHDVRPLLNGNILCTDSAGSFVIEINKHDEIVWSYGLPGGVDHGGLRDPHQAHRLSDGTTLIVDSLNHRLVHVGPRGSLISSISKLRTTSGDTYELYYPRAIEPHGAGWIIVDGTSQLLFVNSDGYISGKAGPMLVGPAVQLRLRDPPRYVTSISNDRIAISDYRGARLVVLKLLRVGEDTR